MLPPSVDTVIPSYFHLQVERLILGASTSSGYSNSPLLPPAGGNTYFSCFHPQVDTVTHRWKKKRGKRQRTAPHSWGEIQIQIQRKSKRKTKTKTQRVKQPTGGRFAPLSQVPLLSFLFSLSFSISRKFRRRKFGQQKTLIKL